MKKLLLITLALILCLGILAACDEPTEPPAGDTPGTQETPGGDETPGGGEPPGGGEEGDETTPEIIYSEDEPLFVAQDRCDIEGDRSQTYYYNYKGELLNSLSTAYIGYYAENGLATALDQSTWKIGFVDKDGVFQIDPIYEDAAAFSESGIALVCMEVDGKEKCGHINSKGETVVPFMYDYATSFYPCGYALAYNYVSGSSSEDDWEKKVHYIIDEQGKVVFEADSDEKYVLCVMDGYFVYKVSDGWVISDYSGKEIERINQQEGNKRVSLRIYDFVYKYVYGEDGDTLETIDVFDGKKFVDESVFYENILITSKRVATTKTGIGYGIEKDDETLIPFVYDRLYSYGDYFVGVKYTGDSYYYDQTFDIYDLDYQKTAENVPYAFYPRNEMYGNIDCMLPNGYFEIFLDNEDYGSVHGIIDYTGKIIVEPVFGRGITPMIYEACGVFDWY